MPNTAEILDWASKSVKSNSVREINNAFFDLKKMSAEDQQTAAHYAEKLFLCGLKKDLKDRQVRKLKTILKIGKAFAFVSGTTLEKAIKKVHEEDGETREDTERLAREHIVMHQMAFKIHEVLGERSDPILKAILEDFKKGPKLEQLTSISSTDFLIKLDSHFRKADAEILRAERQRQRDYERLHRKGPSF